MTELNSHISLKGNPWPRRWRLKDQNADYKNDNLKRGNRLTKQVILSSNEDVLTFKKYYNKKASFFDLTNTKIPVSLRHRCKMVNKIKVSSCADTLYPFKYLKKVTLNIHQAALDKDAGLLRLLKKNKHIASLRVTNFQTFVMFIRSIKHMAQLKKFYLDINKYPLADIGRILASFFIRHPALEKIQLLLYNHSAASEGDSIEKYIWFKAMLVNVFNLKNLKALKLDICSPLLVENDVEVIKLLFENLSISKLNTFDVRVALKNSLDIQNELRKVVQVVDYLAIATAGQTIQSKVFL